MSWLLSAFWLLILIAVFGTAVLLYSLMHINEREDDDEKHT